MKKRGPLNSFFSRLVDPETELKEAWDSAKSGNRSGIAKALLILLVVAALAVLFTAFSEFFQDR